jgi:hypothetical protein
VGGEIVGQLAMPVDEGRAQRRTRHRGVDVVVHCRGAGVGITEPVGVAPPADDPWRQGHQPV